MTLLKFNQHRWAQGDQIVFFGIGGETSEKVLTVDFELAQVETVTGKIRRYDEITQIMPRRDDGR
jgi:hypothetical protein